MKHMREEAEEKRFTEERERDALDGPHEEAEIQRKALRRGKT